MGETKLIKRKINDPTNREILIVSSAKKKSLLLKEKEFKDRQSLLEQLYEDPHINNVRHIFLFLFLCLIINQVTYGVFFEQRWVLHIDMILFNFSDGHLFIFGWLIQFAYYLLVFPMFRFWAFIYCKIEKNAFAAKLWNICSFCATLYFYYYGWKRTNCFVSNYNLTFTSSFTLLAEQTRMLMKVHAFLRENVSKIFHKQIHVCSFMHYIYFNFAPTLIYRDSYPRRKSISWPKVLLYACELCVTLIFMCIIYESTIISDGQRFMSGKYHLKDICWAIMKNTISTLLLLFLCFYFILHSWHNFFGELTMFADRLFYLDWWNSTSYGEYYRKWNVLVYDWLCCYMYKDILWHFKSNALAKFAIFLISAIFHEYILGYAIGMCYPVLFIIFMSFGPILSQVKVPKMWIYNVLFIYGFAIGCSLNLMLYVLEFYVRRNPCAINSPNYPFDFLYSKTFFSDCLLN